MEKPNMTLWLSTGARIRTHENMDTVNAWMDGTGSRHENYRTMAFVNADDGNTELVARDHVVRVTLYPNG